jgi:hypothetical protein
MLYLTFMDSSPDFVGLRMTMAVSGKHPERMAASAFDGRVSSAE